jgi:hypothetical protein
MDDVKRGGKPPRPATVSRFKKENSKDLKKILRGGTIPEREARGEKNARAKYNADTAGMMKQSAKAAAVKKKRSVVAPGIRTKPAAKKAPAEKPAAGRATPSNKDTYNPGAKGSKKGYKMNSKYEKGLSLKGQGEY